MASEKEVLSTVIDRFPESCLQITELFSQSDYFRSICLDYALCVQVIKNLDAVRQMHKKGYRKEYEVLLKDLERELISKLQE